MQIIINSVYISSDDVNGWTQARSFIRLLSRFASVRYKIWWGRCSVFWWWWKACSCVRACTKNGKCLIYAFFIFEAIYLDEMEKLFKRTDKSGVLFISFEANGWMKECDKYINSIYFGLPGNFDHFIYNSMNRTIFTYTRELWSIQIMTIKLTNKIMFLFVISIHYIRQTRHISTVLAHINR